MCRHLLAGTCDTPHPVPFAGAGLWEMPDPTHLPELPTFTTDTVPASGQDMLAVAASGRPSLGEPQLPKGDDASLPRSFHSKERFNQAAIVPPKVVGKLLAQDMSELCICRVCREELSLKKSVIGHNTSSAKHKASVAKALVREKSDNSIFDALQRYEDVHHPKGEERPYLKLKFLELRWS